MEKTIKRRLIQKDNVRLFKGLKIYDHRVTDRDSDEIKRSVSFFEYMEEIITHKTQLQCIGTAKNYKAALKSFRRFRENKDIFINEIDSALICDYQTYLKTTGITQNSVSFYMRIIRAVYNRAKEQSLTPKRNPFLSVFTGMEKTRKRAISTSEIKRIKDLDLTRTPHLEFARDIFMFLFLCRGMSFVDAAFLKKSDLCDGILSYRRNKTGQLIHIRVICQIQKILDQYNTETHFLLPIISSSSKNERLQYESALHRINNNLKKIGEIVGLSKSLSTYVSRHSWATIAKKKNIPVNVISDALGHESIATTQIYLDSLDSSIIDKANEIVINEV